MSDADGSMVVAADVVRGSARAFERDRYLSALLGPAASRDGLIAVAAFAGEIGRIPTLVEEPVMGEVRLQWWRDALATTGGDHGTLSGHPVADALAAAQRRHRLPLASIEAVIDAQFARLEDRPFATLDDLTDHMAVLEGGLFELAWRILGGEGDAPDVLARVGSAYGVARAIVEAPAVLAQGRMLLPTEALLGRGLAIDAMPTPDNAELWCGVLGDIARDIEAQMQDLSRRYREADFRTRLAALPLALVRPYLKLSEHVEPAALWSKDLNPLTRVWRIWRCSRTGRV